MRSVLETLLYERYPGLYQQKDAAPRESLMIWGFAHGDGWFALIDALSETINALDPDAQVRQVKEKFGTLSFYCTTQDETVYATIHAACMLSARICEQSGQRGTLIRVDGWYTVRSAHQIAELRHANTSPPKTNDLLFVDHSGTGLRPTLNERLSFSREDAVTALRHLHGHTLDKVSCIDFPPALFDLVDSTLRAIAPARSNPNVKVPLRIDRIIWNQPDGLEILPSFLSLRRYAEELAEQEAANQEDGAADDLPRQIMIEHANRILAITNFANAMSKRIDPQTGSYGPVDDQGRLIRPDASGPEALNRLQTMRQVRELLSSFDLRQQFRPHVVCKNMLKPNLQVREHVARSIRSGAATILLPHIYNLLNRNVHNVRQRPLPYQIAFALAQQHGWHIAMPIEMSQFFMGRRSRPQIETITHFIYDQDHERHVQTDLPFTLQPAPDNRVFDLNPMSQAVFQHVQHYPQATKEEWFEDTQFAASSWLGEPSLKKELAQDLTAERLQGKAADLAHAILWAAQTRPKAKSQAPATFDPSEHEVDAARLYQWRIDESFHGDLYLRANHIKNHGEIPDDNNLVRSSPLIWYDLELGWARTRSRYYRLIGEQF